MKSKVAMLAGAVAVCLSMGSTPLRADAVSENTNFIEKVYQDLLQRPASTLEIASGLSALGSETNFLFALSIDTSNEYYQLLAGSYVQDLLGRPATPTDLSFFTPLLSSNSDEFVQAQIAGSAEFFLKSGGTNADFVTAVYKDFLNRTPSSSDVAKWVGLLGTLSREQ